MGIRLDNGMDDGMRRPSQKQGWVSIICWTFAGCMSVLIFGLALSWLLLVNDSSLFWGELSVWEELFAPNVKELEAARNVLLDETLNSTLGFGKIWVISMPEATEKRSTLQDVADASDIDINFVDGVAPDDVDLDSLPPDANGEDPHGLMRGYALGAWQAHMNTLDKVIEEGLATAVITEDDIDWDVRIKQQLRSAARAFQTLTEPVLFSHDRVRPEEGHDPEISFDDLPPVRLPKTSPYGDNWDVLWLGLCRQAVSRDIPYVVRENDATTPPKHLIRVSALDKPWTLLEEFPEHTRIYHQMREGLCSLFYAVTLEAAKKIRHEFGDVMMSGPLDVMLLQYCNPEGRPSFGDKTRLRCYSAMPQIFNHWNPGPRDTQDIRFSARVNKEELRARNGVVAEDDQDSVWIDSWPDEAQEPN